MIYVNNTTKALSEQYNHDLCEQYNQMIYVNNPILHLNWPISISTATSFLTPIIYKFFFIASNVKFLHQSFCCCLCCLNWIKRNKFPRLARSFAERPVQPAIPVRSIFSFEHVWILIGNLLENWIKRNKFTRLARSFADCLQRRGPSNLQFRYVWILYFLFSVYFWLDTPQYSNQFQIIITPILE